MMLSSYKSFYELSALSIFSFEFTGYAAIIKSIIEETNVRFDKGFVNIPYLMIFICGLLRDFAASSSTNGIILT
jgi:hypothetical protein